MRGLCDGVSREASKKIDLAQLILIGNLFLVFSIHWMRKNGFFYSLLEDEKNGFLV